MINFDLLYRYIPGTSAVLEAFDVEIPVSLALGLLLLGNHPHSHSLLPPPRCKLGQCEYFSSPPVTGPDGGHPPPHQAQPLPGAGPSGGHPPSGQSPPFLAPNPSPHPTQPLPANDDDPGSSAAASGPAAGGGLAAEGRTTAASGPAAVEGRTSGMALAPAQLGAGHAQPPRQTLPGACFICSEAGHWSRDCPRRSTQKRSQPCFTCGQEGHWASQCPTKRPK